MQAIKDVYWNCELEWDVNTVSHIKVVEDNGYNSLVLKEHKTTSAATLKNDVLVRRSYEEYFDEIWCTGVSEKSPNVPERSGWRRAYLIFSGLKIQQIDEKQCEVSFVHCFDFGGWIHVKFVEDEQKRVALRLSRIKKKVEDDAKAPPRPVHVPAPAPVRAVAATAQVWGNGVRSMCPECREVSESAFCGNDGSKLILVCANCDSPVSGSAFCGECGFKLV